MTRSTADNQLPLGTDAGDSNVSARRHMIEQIDLSGFTDRQAIAANSALWAAWADATGWISELTDDKGLRRRTRGRALEGPMDWTRKIGGRTGVNVGLPAGTYSDDTQLRLSVCRSYTPRGFDPETFSSVELTVWPSYALGGGTGTKAAASAMTRTGARWSANRPENYFNAGGNGAAMRAQPHAWRDARPVHEMLTDVMRDAVSTHGHPAGLVGAAISALAVADSMPGGSGRAWDGGDSWLASFVEESKRLADIPAADPELDAYWMPSWVHPEMGTWDNALHVTLVEGLRIAAEVERVVRSASTVRSGYSQIVDALDLRVPEKRGSGLLTVLAALGLVGLANRHSVRPEQALLVAVNELHTDTDTIATMAGAVMGCRAESRPVGPLLDANYIVEEAARVAAPGGPGQSAFRYPDLLHWEPPRTQADAVVEAEGSLYVAGLGRARALREPIVNKGSDFAWQWLRLHTTQTILAKRRIDVPAAKAGDLQQASNGRTESPDTSGSGRRPPAQPHERSESATPAAPRDVVAGVGTSTAVESALHRVRSAGYDVKIIGMHLAKLAVEHGAPAAAAFGALVAADLEAMVREGRGGGTNAPR